MISCTTMMQKSRYFFILQKELVLRQTFLIAKGYFDPKEYFQAIKIDNLDDQTFDNKIRSMFNWFRFISFCSFCSDFFSNVFILFGHDFS
jgi:hypothetical protein